MTYRVVVSRGLIAGLTFGEMRRMSPGFVMDMFVSRLRYDDQQHGIKRERQPRCAD